MFRACALVCLVLVGCNYRPFAETGTKAVPAGSGEPVKEVAKVGKVQVKVLTMRTASVPAELPEEKIIEALILKYGTEPDKIRFLTWGPHDLAGEAQGKFLAYRPSESYKFIRVLFLPRYKDLIHQGPKDLIFALRNGEPTMVFYENIAGDDWLQLNGRFLPTDIRNSPF